jgi:hypothetical protein
MFQACGHEFSAVRVIIDDSPEPVEAAPAIRG